MINIWMLAGGTLAAAAIAVGMRLLRQRGDVEPASSVQPVSEEWLSHARAGKEQEW